MSFKVIKVNTNKELRAFIHFPYRFYRDDPLWVPPLLMEEKKKYFLKSNPMLEHCHFQQFLLLEDGKPAGRVNAFINHLANEHWNRKIGMFGLYECIDNEEGSRLLLQSAFDWLKQNGAEAMQGPWSFASQECGLLFEGFDSSPMIMASYNPVYYIRHFETFGFSKVKDLLVYKIDYDESYIFPEKYIKVANRIENKYKIIIRPIDIKQIKKEARILMKVANESTKNNWGYIPVTEKETDDLANSMKMIADPDIILIGEIGGKPVGYMIVLPNVNVLLKGLKGRLLPGGIFKLKFGMKNIREYRIWALGVIPEYHRKAVDVLFYKKLYEIFAIKNPSCVEANYVLEDNMVMNNPIKKLGFKVSKKYRVYEKEIK